jgi:hypothetical protein
VIPSASNMDWVIGHSNNKRRISSVAYILSIHRSSQRDNFP